MTDLLPCPFCGSSNVDPEGWMSSDKRTGPACDECAGSTESIERWNTRVPAQLAPDSHIQKYRDLLQACSDALAGSEYASDQRLSEEVSLAISSTERASGPMCPYCFGLGKIEAPATPPAKCGGPQ